MKIKSVYSVILLLFILSIKVYAQTDTEFWFVVPEINRYHNDRPIRFVFTTTTFPADITMEMPANGTFVPINLSLPANTTKDTVFSTNAELNRFENRTLINELSTPADQDNISNKAIKITSTAPITAYYEVNTTNNSDIWSLKGENGLGMEFYIPFQDIGQNRQHDDPDRGTSSIEIIGTGGTTVVEIHPSKAVYRNGANPNFLGVYTITLEEGEVYTLSPAWDPTVRHGTAADLGWWGVFRDQHIGGTYIRVLSGDRVAVVVKDDSVTEDLTEQPLNPRVESGASGWGGWDIIADQWVPKEILGTEYIAMRGTLLSAQEFVFVVATENNTRIWWASGLVLPLDTGVTAVNTVVNEGEQVRISFPNTQAYKYIISNKKLSVLHVSGVGTEMGGAVLPPIDKCTGSTSIGFTRSKGDPARFHMNIMVRTSAKDGFLINGAAPAFFNSGSFTDIPGTPWSVARIQNISNANIPPDLTTKISNTKDVFHLGVINETDGGAGCRFGYFSDFNEIKVSALSLQGGEQPSATPRACIGDSIQLFASGGTTYEWWPLGGLSDVNISNPKTLVTGYQVYYVKVSGFCGQSDTASVSISPLLQPEASFLLEKPSGCAPLDIEIRNVSTNVSRMFWDFNSTLIDGFYDQDTVVFKKINGNDSVVVAVDSIRTHRFRNTSFEPIDSIQTYELKLKVKTAKCYDSLSTYITVYPEVTADFTLSDLNDTLSCNPAIVEFQSSVLSINEDAYKWEFGDGALSANPNPTHEYNNIQLNRDTIFSTQLIVRSQWFCRDTARQDFLVHPYLEGGFTIDEDQGCSPFNVRITNLASGADTIFLDYGDGTDTVMTTFNFIDHFYENDGTIDKVDTNVIVMRVKNDEGCEFIDRDTIIVYPKVNANYTIDGGVYTGCNSRTATFANTSNIGTHTASKFLWTFGDGTSSNAVVPVPHPYNNTSPADKNYPFKLHAESIYGCSDDTTRTITMYRAFADFAIDTDEGCSPLTVDITNNSEGSALVYLWTFNNGDPNSALPDPPDPTYNNTTAAVITPAIQLQVTGNGGCSTTASSIITVHPEISVTIAPLNQSGCDSLEINFTSTITNIALPGVLYDWDFGDATSSTSPNPTHIYRNLSSNAAITYPVRLDVETEYGCTNFATTDVTVEPYVRAKFAIDKANGCSPHTINVTPTYYVGIEEYRWDFNGDAITDATTATATPQPYTFPRNQTGADITYNVTLDVFSPLGTCTDSYVIPIKVYSETKADFDPQGSIGCNPYEVTFINNSDYAASNLWNFDDGTTSAVIAPTHTFTNLLNSTQTFDVNLAVTSNRGCTHDTTATVGVRRYVDANFDIDVSEGCSPLTVNITNNSKGGTYRWYWNSIDGSGAADYTSNTTGVTFDHEYINNSGNVETVYLTCIAQNASGCRDTLTRPIIVQSAMNAQFVSLSGTENCTPFAVNFDNQTNPASDAQYFTWDFDDGTSGVSTKASPDISHTFTNSTDVDITRTVTLTAESAYGCPNSTTLDITIYRRVIASFDLNTNEDCSPVEIQITNKSKGGTYQWSWDNPPLAVDLTTTDATANPILHTYTNTSEIDVIRNLTVVAGNGHAACNKTLSKAITVHSSVVADFAISDAANCNPLTSTFSPTVSVDADKFYWYYSDGTAEITSAASPNATHVFNNAGTTDKTFQIEMRAETVNGCTNSITKSVQVYSYLDANFAMESSSGCPPFSTTIENTSFGNAANTYDWSVDGSVEFSSTGLLPFTHTYDNPDPTKLEYDILLHAENVHGCVSEYTGTITVAENVQAIFSMSNDGCTPLPVTFTNSSLAPAGTLYYWDFKDGSTSTLKNPGTHTFYNPSREDDKDFNVELSIISPSYCTDNTSAVVTAYHQPLSEFYLEKSTSCPPLITDMDMNESVGEDEWEWRFGDGNFNTSDINIDNYTYQNTLGNAVQNYKLELWVGTNEGCKDSSHLILSVYPEVIADFTYDAAGCSPFVSQFVNTSQNANYYSWNFADGNASNVKNPTNRFDNIWDTDRTYKVYLKASSEYNCWDTITHPVTAYVQPTAEFDVTPPVQKFPLNRAFIDNLTEPITGPFNYLWEYGNIDESTSTAVEPQYFDYDHWGEKVIKLSVTSQTSDCKDDISKMITILPPDVNAKFEVSDSLGCLNEGFEVQFTAAVSAFSENYDYEWDFGDGSDPDYSRVTSHVYDAAGIYYVKLTATSTEGAGEDYEYKTIRVYSNPIVNFEVSPKLAMLNIDLEARVEFFNLTECNDTSGCIYFWDFGDGGTANSRDVTHNYTELGIYDISLVATTKHECVDSLVLLEEVEIIGAGEIAFPNAFTPNGDGLNDTFRPVSEGVIKYELLIYNRWGELIFTTKDLSAGWNGTIKGQYAKPDVYVWKAMGNFTNGRSFELAGDVTLIR